MTTPADELRAAAFRPRNPLHLPGLKIGVDYDLAQLLADWLDSEAKRETYTLAEFGYRSASDHAMAVARLINGSPS